MKALVLAALAALSLAAACPPLPPTPVPGTGGTSPIPVVGGAGGEAPVPAECSNPPDACARAGCNLARLGCPERVTAKGTPFATTCRDSAADNRPYPTACIAAASSCPEARACQ